MRPPLATSGSLAIGRIGAAAWGAACWGRSRGPSRGWSRHALWQASLPARLRLSRRPVMRTATIPR